MKTKKTLAIVICAIALLTATVAFGDIKQFNIFGNHSENIENFDNDIAYCVMLDEIVVTPNMEQ